MRVRRARWWRGLALAALLGIVAAGCGDDDEGPEAGATTTEGNGGTTTSQSAGDDGPVPGGDLTYLMFGVAPDLFEPAGGVDGASAGAEYLMPVFGVLVYEDYETSEVVPSMAESLEATDASTWVLTLRDGVTFSDGTPFDAEAVKFNWERAQGLGPEIQASSIAAEIASMTIVDDLTLEIALAEANSAFDHTVARSLAYVGSPTALQADEEGFLQSEPVGAGPFLLESFGADGTASYARNPDYWDQPKPYVDTLTIRNIPDDDQRLNTFLSGDAQMMGASPSLDLSPVTEGEILTLSAPGGGGNLIFNTAKAPFDDLTARLAVQHAIDRDQMNDVVSMGNSRVASSIFIEDSPFHAAGVEFPAYDPEEAQRLFDEYAQATGGPMVIQFTTHQLAATTGEFFQAALADFENVEVQLNLVDPAQLVPTLLSGGFDLAGLAWSSAHPLSDFQTFYGTGAFLNVGGYSNPEVDELLAQAAATTDEADQAELFAKIQQIIVTDDAVAYFVGQNVNRVAATDEVHDARAAVDGVWFFEDIWLSP